MRMKRYVCRTSLDSLSIPFKTDQPYQGLYGVVAGLLQIFEIYSLKAGRPEDGQDTVRGLGFLSSHKDIITVEFELLPPAQPLTTASLGKRVRGSKRPMSEKIKPVIIKVDIHQDVASLKNRKGDTGSVIWRSR